jgi:tetratricopeptide (TPR) repeat protein
MRNHLAIAAMAAGAFMAALPAAAQDAAVKCNSSNPDDIISGCTAIINAGQESSGHLAMAYTFRGVVFANRGMADRAIADYSQAIRLSPSDATAYFNRGIEYGVAHQFDLAISDFTQAIALRPDYGKAYLDRGRVYQAKGDDQRAQADFQKAKSLGAE